MNSQFIVNQMAKKVYKANCDNRGIYCMLATFSIPSPYKVISKVVHNTGIGNNGYTPTSSTLNNPNPPGYTPRPNPRPSTGGLGQPIDNAGLQSLYVPPPELPPELPPLLII